MKQKIEILGVEIDNFTMQEVLKKIDKLLVKNQLDSNLIITANSEMIINAYHNTQFKKIINQAKFTVADGAGVLWAAKILGVALKQRIAGVDLFEKILELAAKRAKKIYLLGAKPKVVKQAQVNIKAKLPEIKLKSHHGYLDKSLTKKVLAEIQAHQTDVLFVAMGSPLQEKWLAKNLAKLDVNIAMGVGGSFDIIAGVKKRAPVILQQLALEWFYRLLQEPKRIARVATIPEFILRVLMTKFSR